MSHHANPDFWKHYHRLPVHIQKLADQNFALLKEDPRHPSLHLKSGRNTAKGDPGTAHCAAGTTSNHTSAAEGGTSPGVSMGMIAPRHSTRYRPGSAILPMTDKGPQRSDR